MTNQVQDRIEKLASLGERPFNTNETLTLLRHYKDIFEGWGELYWSHIEDKGLLLSNKDNIIYIILGYDDTYTVYKLNRSFDSIDKRENIYFEDLVHEVNKLMAYPTTMKELKEGVEKGTISAIITNGVKYRLFIGVNNGSLCYLAKGRRRYGYRLTPNMINGTTKIIPKIEKTEEYHNKQYFKVITKYRKYANLATFTNAFIEAAKKLPATYDEWINDKVFNEYNKVYETKSLYNYGVTTGPSAEGTVITVDRVAKVLGTYEGEALRNAIKNKTKFTSNRVKLGGYEATVEIIPKETGELYGYLSMEYVGCGNGHYYLLINDNSFIKYDTD